MNDLKNRCQKRKLKENVCKEKKRKAIESWKWQTYAVLLLAGMISHACQSLGGTRRRYAAVRRRAGIRVRRRDDGCGPEDSGGY